MIGMAWSTYTTVLFESDIIILVGKYSFFNGNLMNLTCFGGKALVNKLWPLLRKTAKLDLRLTKHFVFQIKPSCLSG